MARVSSDNPDGRVLWFFIGFGNLNNNNFTVKPLKPIHEDSRLARIIHVPDGLQVLCSGGPPKDLITVVDQLQLGDMGCVQLFSMDDANADILLQFVPLVVVMPLMPPEFRFRCG